MRIRTAAPTAWVRIVDRNKMYEIFPQVGVDSVKFGMSADDVESLWGAPARRSKNFLGNKTEVRDASLVTYDRADDGVAEVGFPSSYGQLTLKGVQVFQQPHAKTIGQLRQLDSDAFEGDGFIVFKNLGVSLSGFRSDDFDALTATAFKLGWWDDELADMTKLVL
jgi:hypothetical protein